MAYTDHFVEELSRYLPTLTKQNDFDAFWQETLEQSARMKLEPSAAPYDYPSDHVKVYDIAYNGFDGTRIHGWYILPAFLGEGPFPCLIHYHGYTGNRGWPADFMQWAAMGVAVVSVDCREQCGSTGSRAAYSSGATQSACCKGILDKDEYYFRAVYMDCVRAIDFACVQKAVDAKRIVIEGASQGGALTMAVCALDSRPCMALADVPSNSDLVRRVEGANGSFSAVTDYLKTFPMQTEQAFKTLSYFDTMNLADRIQCRVLASVAMKDSTCPAQQYFATYNRIASPKQIYIYPFNGHEGGGPVHNEIKMRFVREHL